MKELLQQLEDNVNQEIEVQLQIEAILDRQMQALVRGQRGQFPALLTAAEEGLHESARLEEERQSLIRQLAGLLGIAEREVTLAKLEETLETAPSLAASGAELKAILLRVRETNRKVSLLLRHSILFIEDLLEVIRGGAPQRLFTYTPQGRRREAAPGAVSAEG